MKSLDDAVLLGLHSMDDNTYRRGFYQMADRKLISPGRKKNHGNAYRFNKDKHYLERIIILENIIAWEYTYSPPSWKIDYLRYLKIMHISLSLCKVCTLKVKEEVWK